MASTTSFIGKLLLAYSLLLLFAVVAAVTVYAAKFILIVLAAVLVGVILRTFGDWLGRLLRIDHNAATAIGIWIMLILLGLVIFFGSPVVIEQTRQLREAIPAAFDHLKDNLTQYRWVNNSLSNMQRQNILPGVAALIDKSTFFLTSFVEVMAGIVLILVMGVYMALEPETYLEEIFRLIPPSRRGRIRQVLQKINVSLHWWLIGGLIDMAIVGGLTTIGLMVLGLPMALVLGLIAGLLIFIPTFGPLLSVIPAILIASSQSGQQIINVIVLYAVIQTLESSLVTPLIMRKSVRLPPAFILIGQMLFAILFGFLGLALAIPILAILAIVIRMLYINDVLGQPPPKSEKGP